MALTSIQFPMFCFLAVILTNLTANARARSVVATVASGLFIASYLTSPLQLVGLLALLVIGYLSIIFVRRRRSWQSAATCIFLIVVLFVYLKHYSFVDILPRPSFPYLTLGLSYILFRVIHLVVDSVEGELPDRIRVTDYFNYTCNFLTFISGPIQRFQDYRAATTAARMVREGDAYDGALRIAMGYFKILAISATAKAVFDKLSGGVFGAISPSLFAYSVHYAVTVSMYTIFLYYNFSGFIDVVIGFGKLMGLNLPENFNHPFRAANFLDFWGRWHMTLSHWFRDYMFNPLLRFLMGKFESAALAPVFGVFCFFATFTVMGIWHGATTVFLAYGVVMGSGASLNKVYQLFSERVLGRKGYRNLRNRAIYIYVCRGMTFAYFGMAVTALWVDMAQLSHIARSLGVIGAVSAFMLLTGVGATGFCVSDLCQDALSRFKPQWTSNNWTIAWRNAGLAALILATFAANALFSGPPEFVYRAF